MPSKYWIKLYHEIIDDPKMMRMPDEMFAKTIKLFLLAGDHDQDGELPSPEDIAWRLRYDPSDVDVTLRYLERNGIISQNGSGAWCISKWADRQGPISGAERVRRHRISRRNEPVTNRYTESDQESDTEEMRSTSTSVTDLFHFGVPLDAARQYVERVGEERARELNTLLFKGKMDKTIRSPKAYALKVISEE